MAVLLHAVSLAGVCRKERISPVPQVRARPEEMRCVGSKRTPELGRDMLLAASIVKSSVAKAHGRNRTVLRREICECAHHQRRLVALAEAAERRCKPYAFPLCTALSSVTKSCGRMR